ncbi:unnamed protein product [Polarella glacialis]|uniref:Uncharacterized protein n=1 Tax=Polarella glacialis TaxID=89957 RepID=A0A813IVL3_POLGL|nr:unnamed protein product [Polarella glacialis]
MPYRKILLEVRLLLHVRISHFQRQENTGGLLSQQAVGAFFRQLILNGSNVFLFRTRVLRLISLFNWEDVLSDGVCCISPPSGSSCCGGRCLCFVVWLGVGLFLVLCSFLFVSFLVVVFVGAGCFLPSRFCVSFPVALVWFLLCVWFCVLFFVFVLCWSFCFVALVFGLFWPLFGAGFVSFVWLLFLVFCFLFLFCCVFVFVFVFLSGLFGVCFCFVFFVFVCFCFWVCLFFVVALVFRLCCFCCLSLFVFCFGLSLVVFCWRFCSFVLVLPGSLRSSCFLLFSFFSCFFPCLFLLSVWFSSSFFFFFPEPPPPSRLPLV